MLASEGAGEAPVGFVGAVRARRRRVLAGRAGVVGVMAIVLAAVVVALPRQTPDAPRPDGVRPLVEVAVPGPPAALPGSMLALRRAWSEDGGSGAWLTAFQTEAEAPPDEPLRITDSERVLRGL